MSTKSSWVTTKQLKYLIIYVKVAWTKYQIIKTKYQVREHLDG